LRAVGDAGRAAAAVSGADADVEVFSTRTVFPSGRDIVRTFAAHKALDLVRRLLSGLALAGGDWAGKR